ncbi:MAG: hypothetical protein ACRD19_07210 [Terriglobia bacterium]
MPLLLPYPSNGRDLMSGIFIALLLLAPHQLARAASQWSVQNATITYHVTHPLHRVAGVSHTVRGKGVCHAGKCNFLIAVPVKSFHSGDSNRDLHMLQITRGAQFPMVIVRALFPAPSSARATIHANLTIQFAGNTARYERVPFQDVTKGNEARISGTIPATLSDFKIPPPEFLLMPIRNKMPVSVEMTWRQEK